MPSLDAQELAKAYSSGLSMADIAKQSGVSLHKVAYWMDKFKIPRRTRSESAYVKQNPSGNPFKITKIDTIKKTELIALGIGLFLGEGNKRDTHHLRFANSDPQIMKLFLNFLRKICTVRESKIKATLNIFNDLDYESCSEFWIKITGIPKSRFYKPTIRPGKTGTYKNKSKYGTITILVSNKKLLGHVKAWCEKYLEKYAK